MNIEPAFYFLPENKIFHTSYYSFLNLYGRHTENINIQRMLKLRNLNHCVCEILREIKINEENVAA